MQDRSQSRFFSSGVVKSNNTAKKCWSKSPVKGRLDLNPLGVAHIKISVPITKLQIAFVPLDPVADYVHMLDLNTRTCVG